MDQKTIDRLLIDLLRVPLERRDQNEVARTVANLSAASHLETVTATPSQREQIKLMAIVELLAYELQMELAHVTLEMSADTEGLVPLTITMRNPDGNYVFGRGRTAQEALQDLHDYKPKVTE